MRIGIEKLLDEDEEMDYSKIDFTKFLGKTDKRGHWLDVEETPAIEEKEMDTSSSDPMKDNDMYVFEGVDYRSTSQKGESDFFDRLIQQDDDDDRERTTTSSGSSERRLPDRPARRPMTEEEKAARAAKIRETKARRKQEMVRSTSLVHL